jgi:hypothetical protein
VFRFLFKVNIIKKSFINKLLIIKVKHFKIDIHLLFIKYFIINTLDKLKSFTIVISETFFT